MAARSELLAQHYAQAGMIEKAVTNWLRAGQQGIERSAMVEAIALLRKGLDQLSQLFEGVQRQEFELELQLALGRALMATRGFAAPEVGDICARLRDSYATSSTDLYPYRCCLVSGCTTSCARSCIEREKAGRRCCSWVKIKKTYP